ncbi:MAG: hypothetical protein J5691_00130 [Bacilli bacterium]|nr:hypothetical protein [Bacilli bacterium]
MAAVITSHIWEGKMVHAIYSDVVESPLTAPIELDTIKAGIEDAPEVAELRVLRTSCKEIIAGEDAGKYAVRAVLRYVPEAESESL